MDEIGNLHGGNGRLRDLRHTVIPRMDEIVNTSNE